MKNTSHLTIRRTVPVLFALTLALGGCAAAEPTPASPQSTAENAVMAADTVTIDDAWIKAASDGMTAAFGVLHNPTDDDITVVSATTPAAEMVELHETVEDDKGKSVMREIDGGFIIPAGGALELAPGGNHIMLMGVTGALEPGQDVSVTLTFSDESALTFDATVKDFSGADENYVGDSEHGEHDTESDAGH